MATPARRPRWELQEWNMSNQVGTSPVSAGDRITVPLHRLSVSPHNVRRSDRKVEIESLMASIRAHGLLNNLVVAPIAGGRFSVVAGGRRLAALKALARDGHLARDFPVPCVLIAGEAAEETSLVENISRRAMEAMDEVDAFAALAAQGQEVDAIARRFGLSERHVAQRLALAKLSPKLKAAYRRAELSLDAAKAFCLVDDHARQDAVFKALAQPVTHAASVRLHLMKGAMRAADRLVRFVGLGAYQAADGGVTRDLFDDDATYIDDPALVTQLAEAKLQEVCDTLLSQGWGWASIHLGPTRPVSIGQRLQSELRPLDKDEQGQLDCLTSQRDDLDDALAEAEDDDPRWGARDRLDAQIQALQEERRTWDRDLMAHAGCILSVGHDGRAETIFGVIAKADQAKINAIVRRRENTKTKAAISSGEIVRDPNPDEVGKALPWEPAEQIYPKVLVREITAARSVALQQELARRPGEALRVATFALIQCLRTGHGVSGLTLLGRSHWLAEQDGLATTRDAMLTRAPLEVEDCLSWCFSAGEADIAAVFAMLVASNLDLAHEGAGIGDHERQKLADAMAGVLELDMRHHWRADPAFWRRVPKTGLLRALAQSPRFSALADDARSVALKQQAKRSKAELVDVVIQALDGAGWLPDLLITPIGEGRIDMTPEGEAALAAM
jgi:ParB family transcriptional regulator, chromosome partitioning protein